MFLRQLRFLGLWLVLLLVGTAPAQELQLWSWYTTQQDAWQSVIDQCTAETPYSVTSQVYPDGEYATVLRTNLAGNRGPDIFALEPNAGAKGVIQYIRSGDILNLDDAYEQYGWNERLNQSAIDQLTFENGIFSLPTDVNALAVFYNRAMFQEFNLEPPETWAEFADVVQTFAQEGIFPLAWGNRDQWTGQDWFYTLTGQIGGPQALVQADQGEVSWTDPTYAEALTQLRSMVNENYFNPGINALGWQEATDLFYSGQAAMRYTGSWLIPGYRESAPENLDVGVFLLPPVSPEAETILLGGVGGNLAVNANSDNVEAALEFLDCFFTAESQRTIVSEIGIISTTTAANDALEDPLMQEFATYLEDIPLAPRVITSSPRVDEALASGIQALVEGSRDPLTILEAMETAQE